MKAVILCGGLGTRLREETEFRPKPLVPVGDRPILWHIMKTFAHYGIRDFVLCLGYRGDLIKEYFLNYDALNNDFTICLGNRKTTHYHNLHDEHDFNVTLVDTGSLTMTGGRLKRVQKYVQDETFMLTYGDGLADIDLSALIDFHRRHGKLATMSTVRSISRFGLVNSNADDLIVSFSEKPQTDSWMNIGFMVFNSGVFEYLTGDECVLEKEPLERLVADQQIAAYRHEGFFYAMDTYREYQALNEIWTAGKAPWKVW